MKLRVGVIGVGAMGMGVARALIERGFPVVVRDIVPEREAEALAAGATASRPGDAVDVLVTLVVDAGQTRAVVAERRMAAPVHMMCSTIAPRDAEEIAESLAGGGVDMLDAPISGGPARAHAGTLSMMASGSERAFARCQPVIDAMTAKCFRIGPRPGDGSRMKVVNNMLAAANLAAGCEAMALASKIGLDPAQAAEVIGASSGQSWIFDDRMPRALANDYAPRAAARVLLKDVGLFVSLAQSLGLSAPMAEQAQAIFRDTVDLGLAEEDDAAVLKRYFARYAAKAHHGGHGGNGGHGEKQKEG